MRIGVGIAIGIAIGAAMLSRAVFAQPTLASTDPEQQLLEQIAELRAEGSATPASLVEPLRALALFYEEDEDHAFAITALEEARHVTRVNQGLTSADEAVLLRQEVRNEKARGNHARVWELEQDMISIARQNHDDPRMLPIFRELAEDRLALIEEVDAGERPPMIYAGCYNGARALTPYDYTAPAAGANTGNLTSPCIGGINQDLVYRIRGELLMYYADAIELILRTGDYASPELRQLEKEALRTAYARRGRLAVQLSESSGSFSRCPRGTLDDYLALEILDSCLAPVGRSPAKIVVANVGNPEALIRLISYEIRTEAPAGARAQAIAELADYLMLRVPIDRRRLDLPRAALELYERAHRELQAASDYQGASEVFAPESPITLPVYEPNPFASAATAPSRYIDVSFNVTKYGTSERSEVLGASEDATREEKRDLLRLIESTTFRPRFVDGVLADAAHVTVRYRLDP